jgi:hypothetical protein
VRREPTSIFTKRVEGEEFVIRRVIGEGHPNIFEIPGFGAFEIPGFGAGEILIDERVDTSSFTTVSLRP